MKEAVNVHTLGALAAPGKAVPKKRKAKLTPQEMAALQSHGHRTLGAMAYGKAGK